MVDVDSRVTSSQPHRGWIEETSLCLCEGRGEARNFSRNSYALPFPASRGLLSFSRQRRLSVRRPVARLVLIGSLILIRGKSSLNDGRNTRNASGTRDHPLCLILHLVLIPELFVCVCLAPSVVVAKFRAISPSNGLVARSLTRELARPLLRRNLRGSLRKYLLHHCNHNCSSHLHYVDG